MEDELDLNNQSNDDEFVDKYGQIVNYDDEGNLVDPKITLPKGYDDEFNMRGVQSEGDEVDEYLRNYVDAKHSMGLYPKVSSIAGCRFCKKYKLTCQEIVDRFNAMYADGWLYYIHDNDIGASNSVIFDSPF